MEILKLIIVCLIINFIIEGIIKWVEFFKQRQSIKKQGYYLRIKIDGKTFYSFESYNEYLSKKT